MNKYVVAVIACVAINTTASAAVSVSAPWVRATVPVQQSSGAFMVLQSSADARLVGVSSPAAGAVEMHRSQMKGTLMSMQQVESIALPAGQRVDLATGGYHLMLTGLKQQLKEGSTVTLTLVVQHANGKRELLSVAAPVKPIGYAPSPAAPASSTH